MGKMGSEIIITIVREGETEPFDVSIIRDTIKLTAVRSRTQGETVVLRITTFSDQTFPSMRDQLNERVEELGGLENVNGFILDLRNNPGGLLTQAVRVSDAFLESGEIVSTRGREPQDGDRFNADEGDLAEGKPTLPLIYTIANGDQQSADLITEAISKKDVTATSNNAATPATFLKRLADFSACLVATRSN